MKIAVDGNEANVSEKVGVSVYTYNILHYFARRASADLQFVIYLKNPPQSDLPTPSAYFAYHVVKGPFLWSQLFLPFNLYLHPQCDVFFSPAHYAPRFCPIPTVVTIHDVSYLYYPQEFLKKDLYQLKNWTAYSVKKAKKIIAVSETTKKDIMKFYHIPDEKIKVIHNGYQSIINSKKPTAKSQQPYILYVGTIQPRKNLITLINAFNSFLKEKPDYRLIIAGKKGWLYEEIFNHVRASHLEHKVIFTGYVSDEEKEVLYTNASLFVLPSLYEGFGIPLLEAMSLGCPVVSSKSSSLPEIGGNACLYFDPHDPQELAEKMLEIVTNTALAQELVKKGKERVQLFSWEKCAQETLEALKNTVKHEG
ncbi:MAG TPA: glycosyltransferase family 1 protein [Patescibacteria group bacterium]|nr:glycosyltransferase family 1 protein [Patescibacteria group bacterium]